MRSPYKVCVYTSICMYVHAMHALPQRLLYRKYVCMYMYMYMYTYSKCKANACAHNLSQRKDR